MIVNLEVTDVQVNPELNLVNLVITPTFSSGEGFAPIQSISKNGVNIPPIGGNVNIEVPTKTSELENDSDFIDSSDLIPYQLKNDETLETVGKTVAGAINEVNAIAKEKQNALSFFDYEALIESLKLDDSLITGQSIYLEKLNIPDLWVSHNDNVFNDYIYTNDDDFLVDILSGVAVGIYSLGLLETQKVDLTNYYNKTEIETNFRNETQSTIGALIEATELTEITDTTKIAASDSAFLKWFSGLRIKTFLTGFFAKLSGGNTFADAQNFDGRINHKVGEKIYSAASKTEDTINDTRLYNSAGVEIHEICTVANDTKGSGTWIECFQLSNTAKTVRFNKCFPYDNTNAFYALDHGGNGYLSPVMLNFYNALLCSIRSYSQLTIETTNSGGIKIKPASGFNTDFINGGITKKQGTYFYDCASPTSDTINDTRAINESGAQIKAKCTFGNTTKGNGIWRKTSVEGAEKALTNNTAINILDINCAINTMQAGTINYAISAIDTVNNTVRSHSGWLSYNVRNQNGVITTNLVHNATMENDMGLISDTWALTNGTNKATLSLNANAAGMTPTSMILHFDISNLGKNDITLL